MAFNKLNKPTEIGQFPDILPNLPISTKEGLQILNENISALDGFADQLVSKIKFKFIYL